MDTSPESVKLRRQRARLFQRLVTGMYYHRHKQFRFLTLSSSPRSPDIRLSWQQLVRKIRTTAPIDLLTGSYLAGSELFNYESMLEPLRIEYFAVFTTEGCGVIHVVYVGDYLPFQWLQDQWSDIHQAYGVNIKAVRQYEKGRNPKGQTRSKPLDSKVYFPPGLAGYVLRQYLTQQTDEDGVSALRTINHSRGWVYPGFVRDWTRIKRLNKGKPMPEIIEAWHKHLEQARYPQSKLI